MKSMRNEDPAAPDHTPPVYPSHFLQNYRENSFLRMATYQKQCQLQSASFIVTTLDLHDSAPFQLQFGHSYFTNANILATSYTRKWNSFERVAA